MAEILSCQGCGAPEGEPKITIRKRRKRDLPEKVEGPPVKLEPIMLADFGERLLCQDCRNVALKLNTRLAVAHLTCA